MRSPPKRMLPSARQRPYACRTTLRPRASFTHSPKLGRSNGAVAVLIERLKSVLKFLNLLTRELLHGGIYRFHRHVGHA